MEYLLFWEWGDGRISNGRQWNISNVQTMVHSFWFRKQLALFLCCLAFCLLLLLLPSNEASTSSHELEPILASNWPTSAPIRPLYWHVDVDAWSDWNYPPPPVLIHAGTHGQMLPKTSEGWKKKMNRFIKERPLVLKAYKPIAENKKIMFSAWDVQKPTNR